MGLWCVNAGLARPQIAAVIEQQLITLDYAHSLSNGPSDRFRFRRKAREDRADRLTSEPVDTALKIALAYQRAAGQPTRTRLIGRERGCYGVGFGGIV